ncbi:MAG: hypothetical protein KGL39_44415 [Patescibacteria group bacterium]|nr:hypothetical protein [Patescibacteria group bacterium]
MISAVVTVATAIVGIAILAVIVSRQSNTAGVIQAASSGFAQDISAAVAPVSGGTFGFGGGVGLPTFG